MAEDSKYIVDFVDKLVTGNTVCIFSATYCPYCTQVKELFKKIELDHFILEVDEQENSQAIKDELFRKTNQKTVPNVFIRGRSVGGCDSIMQKYHDGTLFNLINGEEIPKYDYDLIVIGGGSGGISAAKEAQILGKRVALFDFVKPTNHGTVWGVGGTCVNVGCIPKKLMHHAAILGEQCGDATSTFGWNFKFPGKKCHNWEELIENVQNYIKKLNFNYKKYFKQNNISYFNAYCVFKGPHTVESTDKKGVAKTHTAQTFILGTGGRPHIPDFPGSELAITSDDIFSLKENPNKTLIIGASYIALECAGFLHGLGIDVTVMVRSIFLRGFDQQIAEMIGSDLEKHGVKFFKGFVPCEITKGTDVALPKFKVKMKKTDSSEEKVDYFDTVLLAVGRDACVEGLGLEELGVKLHERSKKIIVDEYDRTTCRSVFAIGDVQYGRMELTPVAIKAGKLLARRLYGCGVLMDYINVPTTVFTPLEYGCVGLSEEAAKETYGPEKIESFHNVYQPLEWAVQNRNPGSCYAKLVCLKSEKMRVVGFHVLGPNAGEMTQGFALGVKLKASKSDFDGLVGIHPTCAEVFTTLEVTRASRPDVVFLSTQGC